MMQASLCVVAVMAWALPGGPSFGAGRRPDCRSGQRVGRQRNAAAARLALGLVFD